MTNRSVIGLSLLNVRLSLGHLSRSESMNDNRDNKSLMRQWCRNASRIDLNHARRLSKTLDQLHNTLTHERGYKMHCVNCDRLLSDYEATRKHAITFKFLDLCKVCFDDVKTIIPVIDRKELMTEHDLDDPEDDTEVDTGVSLEDFDDIIDTIENYRDYDEH